MRNPEYSTMALPAFGTHQPLLFGACLRTSGPILELGSGFFSTPFIHALSIAQRRRCVTLDTNYEYFGAVKSYQSENHEVALLPGFVRNQQGKALVAADRSVDSYVAEQQQRLSELCARYGHFDVAFVDHDPAFLRQPALEFLADKATYLVTHDTEAKSHYAFDFSSFRYCFEDRSVSTWTAIMSNTHECDSFRMFATSHTYDEGAPLSLRTASFGRVALTLNPDSWVGWSAPLERSSPDAFIEITLEDMNVIVDEVQVLVRKSGLSSDYFWITIWKNQTLLRPADRKQRLFVQFNQLAMVGNQPFEAMDTLEIRARSSQAATIVFQEISVGSTRRQ